MGEIEAMGAIDKALGALDGDERVRVLRWAIDKFGGVSGNALSLPGAPTNRRNGANEAGDGGGPSSQFSRIADLMDATLPKSVADHVLVASYWFQVVNDKESFTGQEVNAELKDLGQASKNITDSFNSLMGRKPPAVRQIQKSGSTRQARKLYRLTEPGIRTVERMLAGEASD